MIKAFVLKLRHYRCSEGKSSDLTDREMEVLKLICEELTNKEIGEKLHISGRTVEGHRQNLLLKVGVKNSAGLIIYAIEHSIISVNISRYK